MATHDNAAPKDGWRPEARPWCAARAGACGAVCETRQHCIWLGGETLTDAALIERGEN